MTTEEIVESIERVFEIKFKRCYGFCPVDYYPEDEDHYCGLVAI